MFAVFCVPIIRFDSRQHGFIVVFNGFSDLLMDSQSADANSILEGDISESFSATSRSRSQSQLNFMLSSNIVSNPSSQDKVMSFGTESRSLQFISDSDSVSMATEKSARCKY